VIRKRELKRKIASEELRKKKNYPNKNAFALTMLKRKRKVYFKIVNRRRQRQPKMFAKIMLKQSSLH